MSTINAMVPSLNQKKATVIPTTAQTKRGGAYSVNLVCAKNNRKSLTLTKKLADALQLSTYVYITVYADDGSIALSSASINENSVQFSFSNETDHIVYSANLVRFIAETFALDYTNRTSYSFNNVTFSTTNGVAYAEVLLAKKSDATPCTTEAGSEVETEAETEEFDDDSKP